jgi:hypothetical protein
MSTGGPTITLELPEIVAGLDGLGSRCSFIIPSGNGTGGPSGQALEVEAFAGDGILDPATGTVVASVTYAAGTFSGYTALTWEAVRDYAAGAGLPATLLSITPNNFADGGGIESFTLSGTGGTLPALVGDIDVTLTSQGGPATSPLTTGVEITITGRAQGGGPGTAWTIDFDTSAGAFNAALITYDIDVDDTSGPPSAFASGTDAIATLPLGAPTLIDTGSGINHVWVADADYTLSGDSATGDWEDALTSDPNSGAFNPYLNSPQRMAIGANDTDHPTIGDNDNALKRHRFDGSHTGTVAGTGQEATPTYHKDPVDVLICSDNSLFDGVAFIEWVGVRYAANAAQPPTLNGSGAAFERWVVEGGGGSSTAQAAVTPMAGGVDQRNGSDDVIRLVEGSTTRAIAFEILDDLDSSTITWTVWYRVTFINNVTAF